MMKRPIVVIGAGGHAAVVADALLMGGADVLGFTDCNSARHGTRRCGLSVLGDDEKGLSPFERDKIWLANGIGGVCSTELRRQVQARFENLGWRFATVRHPSAIVSPRARIGEGAQLLAGSVVQVDAEIGSGSIVNTAAVVEHDCKVAEYVHVAPRAVLCGGVTIGANSHIGAGAVVRQGITLGANSVVGAGGVVIRNFEGGGTLAGVPARALERQS